MRLVLRRAGHVHAQLGDDGDGGRPVTRLPLEQRGRGLAPRHEPPHLPQRAAAAPAEGERQTAVEVFATEEHDGDVQAGCDACHLPCRRRRGLLLDLNHVGSLVADQ